MEGSKVMIKLHLRHREDSLVQIALGAYGNRRTTHLKMSCSRPVDSSGESAGVGLQSSKVSYVCSWIDFLADSCPTFIWSTNNLHTLLCFAHCEKIDTQIVGATQIAEQLQ